MMAGQTRGTTPSRLKLRDGVRDLLATSPDLSSLQIANLLGVSRSWVSSVYMSELRKLKPRSILS